MFGFLKKKLKEAADKLSSVVSGEPVKDEKVSDTDASEASKPVEQPQETHIIVKKPVEKTKEVVETKEKPVVEEKKEIKKVGKTDKEKSIKKTKEVDVTSKEKPKKKIVPEKLVDTDTPQKPTETKPKRGLLEKITAVVTEKKISEKEVAPLLEEMKLSLFESDVAVDVAETICNDLKTSLVGKSVKRGEVEKIIHNSLESSLFRILNQEQIDLFALAKEKKPLKIIFLGFNGTGKTTTIARLGQLFKKQGKKVLFAAADTFRAAAINQLEVHGKNLGIDVIKHDYGADPAAVIFDAVKASEARDVDIMLADTAGRSQANIGLMDELKKIVRVNKPDLKILVLDALTGNDIIDQIQLFDEAVGVDAIIFTKVDVYEKGGALLTAAHTINKPILYVGIGQEYDDLKKFSPSFFIDNILS